MTDLRARVAYLQGLAEGMALDDTTREGRLLGEMIDVLEAISGSVDELGEHSRELEQYICEVDQDLSEVEEEVLLGGSVAAVADEFDYDDADDLAEFDEAGDDEAGDEEDPAYAVEGEGDGGAAGMLDGDNGGINGSRDGGNAPV